MTDSSSKEKALNKIHASVDIMKALQQKEVEKSKKAIETRQTTLNQLSEMKEIYRLKPGVTFNPQNLMAQQSFQKNLHNAKVQMEEEKAALEELRSKQTEELRKRHAQSEATKLLAERWRKESLKRVQQLADETSTINFSQIKRERSERAEPSLDIKCPNKG